MTASDSEFLVYDLLVHILEEFLGDYHTLHQCSIVSFSFNKVASKLLYARVKYAPPFRHHVLDLKDRGDIPVSARRTLKP